MIADILVTALLLVLMLVGEGMLLVGSIAAISPVYPRRHTLGIALLGLVLFVAAARALALGLFR